MIEEITSGRTASRRTLIEEINNIADIYGYRNRFYMQNFSDRTDWLSMGAKDLFEVVRKNRKPLTQKLVVARLFARIVAVDEYFRTNERHLPFVKMLCQKYPLQGCSYCKKKPCICPPDRVQQSDLDSSTLELQKQWSNDNWQQHLKEVYGDVNVNRTWHEMYGHFTTEISEIRNISHHISKYTQDELIQQYAKELADTYAWTCGLATNMGVSLGSAVEMVYGRGCGACKQPECQCGPHSFDFLDIDAFEAKYFQDEAASMISSPDISEEL